MGDEQTTFDGSLIGRRTPMVMSGSLVRLRTLRHYPMLTGPPFSWLDYTAPKDGVFVCVVLGVERTDGTGELIQFAQVLERLGYVPRL